MYGDEGGKKITLLSQLSYASYVECSKVNMNMQSGNGLPKGSILWMEKVKWMHMSFGMDIKQKKWTVERLEWWCGSLRWFKHDV